MKVNQKFFLTLTCRKCHGRRKRDYWLDVGENTQKVWHKIVRNYLLDCNNDFRNLQTQKNSFLINTNDNLD